jgi:hypothetical protein
MAVPKSSSVLALPAQSASTVQQETSEFGFER